MQSSSLYSSSQNLFPKVSIIIPTLNEELHIGNLLRDLHHQTIKVDETIIVDGKSKDQTRKIIQSFPHVIVYKKEPNPAAQRTFGGERAHNPLLIFLDADVRLKKSFIANVLQSYKKKHFRVACPIYLPYKSNIIITMIYILFDIFFYIFQKFQPSGAGSCIIVEKAQFKKVKGFNSLLRYDDIAFIRKASKGFAFSFLLFPIYVSDRRFRRDGVIKTFILYIVLSFFFLTNQFRLANIVKYKFSHYKQ